jgi:hypothetical protein
VKPILLPCNSPRPVADNALAVVGPITDNCGGHVGVQITGGVATQTTGCEWTSTFTITATDDCGNVRVCNVTFKWSEDTIPPQFAHCPAGPVTLPCNSPHPTVGNAIAAAGVVSDNCPGYVFYSNCLPPLDGEYNGNFVLTYIPGELLLRNPILGNFTDCFPPPANNGQTEVHSLGTTATFEISMDGGKTWQMMYSPAQAVIQITKTGENESGNVYETEMLQLNISGGTLPPYILGRESPTLRSTGVTIISGPDAVTGEYIIDSFFDIFTELSVDGGKTWLPADKSGIIKLKKAVTVVVTGGSATPTTGCGWTSTFTLTATDACGNVSVCNVTYNWKEDHIPPSFAHCPEAPIILPLNSPRPTIDQALAAAGAATDNCPGTVSVQVTDGGPVLMPGCIMTETFTITAIDECGNKTVCHVTFTWDILLEPPVVQGLSSVCAGTTGVVYSTTPGMSNYFWSISGGGTITAGAGTNAITVTWSVPGPQTVSVYYIDNNGCTNISPTLYNVTVFPLPVITLSGPVSVCNYSSGNFYSTQAGMTNYLWTIPTGAIVTSGGTSSDNFVTITWTTVGTKIITVNYTNNNGCKGMNPAKLVVVVKPAPVPLITGPATCCVNVNTVYSTTPFQSNYVWGVSPGDSIKSGQGTKSVIVKWKNTGTRWISLSYTGVNGCPSPQPTIRNVTVKSCKTDFLGTSIDNSSQIQILENGMEGFGSLDLSLYPNPNDGSFTINVTVPQPGVYSMQLYSNLGVKVYEQNNLNLSGITSSKIDLRHLAPGIYNIILIGKEFSIQKRFIIQK